MFRVYLHATVDETDQLTATFADFRLILPQLEIIVSYLLYILTIFYFLFLYSALVANKGLTTNPIQSNIRLMKELTEHNLTIK